VSQSRRGDAIRTVVAAAGFLALAGAAGAQGAATAAAPEAAQLLRRFDGMYESAGTVARLELTVTRPEKTRTLRLRTWSRGRERALVVVEAPPRDAGIATLKVDDNLWNYLPKISRTIRVPPSMMMGSWMGSDVTNDDLVRETSLEHDYTAGPVRPSADPPGWLVRLEARPGVPGRWEAVEVVFGPDGDLPVAARYFDRRGQLARTMTLGEVQQIGGRRVPTHLTIAPEREPGHRTELRYLHIEFGVDLDDGVFSLAELERGG